MKHQVVEVKCYALLSAQMIEIAVSRPVSFYANATEGDSLTFRHSMFCVKTHVNRKRSPSYITQCKLILDTLIVCD
jgi:hypothetical protein